MSTRGGAREKGGRFYANARYGAGQRIEFRVPWATSLEQAEERAAVMAVAAEALAGIGRVDLVRKVAKDFAEASTAARVAKLQKALDATLKGAIVAPSHDITFGQWANRYTSGELSRLYPDQVKLRDFQTDRERLNLYILKHLKDVPIVHFQFAHAQKVMAALPPMSEANRRQVAQIIGRLLHLAVNPGQLIKASPMPRGWLPKVTKRKFYSCLFPAEELQLLEDAATPEVFRLFCGVLDREGMRLSMLLDSEWSQWGERTFRSTRNKTGDPHMWKIREDTAAAMALWKERMKRAGKAGFTDKPFAGVLELVKGDRTKIAGYYRDRLQAAGVTRPELFASDEYTAMLRAHDMRATFVTVSLTEGKTETWIRDRTSHKSTSMIDRYRRQARVFEELELPALSRHGALCDLVRALGWWKRGGNEAAEEGSMEDVTGEKCTGGDSNPYVQRTVEPKSAGPSQGTAQELVSSGRVTSRGTAKRASTTFPPPLSRSLATPFDGDEVGRAPGATSPGPSKAVPRAHGPVTASEARLVGAQRGAAALALDWDVLDRQAAALAGGDDGHGRGDS